jgi:hypothetical protein
MNIYQILRDCDIYDSFYYLNEKEDRGIVQRVFYYEIGDNQPFTQNWKPISVGIEREQKRGDFIGLPSALGCSKKAYKILDPLIKKSVKLLPVNCSEGDYSLLKVTDIVDCLDHENSGIDRFDSGRIMWINPFAFYPDKLRDKHFFKIPEIETIYFASQIFKDCVEKHNLEGLIFRPAWSNDK